MTDFTDTAILDGDTTVKPAATPGDTADPTIVAPADADATKIVPARLPLVPVPDLLDAAALKQAAEGEFEKLAERASALLAERRAARAEQLGDLKPGPSDIAPEVRACMASADAFRVYAAGFNGLAGMLTDEVEADLAETGRNRIAIRDKDGSEIVVAYATPSTTKIVEARLLDALRAQMIQRLIAAGREKDVPFAVEVYDAALADIRDFGSVTWKSTPVRARIASLQVDGDDATAALFERALDETTGPTTFKVERTDGIKKPIRGR